MKERQILDCLIDLSDMMYRRTGDKWYLNTALETAKKIKNTPRIKQRRNDE